MRMVVNDEYEIIIGDDDKIKVYKRINEDGVIRLEKSYEFNFTNGVLDVYNGYYGTLVVHNKEYEKIKGGQE